MFTLIDIGERLVAKRRALGMSQRELGSRVGVLQPQVARWEADRYRSASLARVSAVAEILGVTATSVETPIAAETPATYAPTTSPLLRLQVDPDVIGAFCRSHSIVRLEFFGSVLNEHFSVDSDVDVLVTYARDCELRLFELADHELELSAIFRRKVDLHTRAAVERNPNYIIRESILGTARVVYEA